MAVYKWGDLKFELLGKSDHSVFAVDIIEHGTIIYHTGESKLLPAIEYLRIKDSP